MNMPSMSIAGRRISQDDPPYIIAELSANHNGKLETALRIVEEAKKAGADAVKLQTYRPDTITLDSDSEDFRIHGGLWDGRTLYELYEEAHMPWEWHKPLFDHARNLGITIFSSPFDTTAVDLLEDLNTPAYKIASFEAVDIPLIEYVASTGKPMIISTGMADADEIQEAISAAKGAGCNELAVLHCVSGYPAPAADYNLRTIQDMVDRFQIVAGLSDHTLGNSTAIASIAMGASIIEKHFTLNKDDIGPDHAASLEPEELKNMIGGIRNIQDALGDGEKKPTNIEIQNMEAARKSIVTKTEIKRGDVFSEENLTTKRPGTGISPMLWDKYIGKKSMKDYKKDTLLKE